MDKRQKIEEAFERMKSTQVKSDCLYSGKVITDDDLKKHSKYVQLESGEVPLAMVDARVAFWGRMTGLVITDRNVYYRCMKMKMLFRGLTMFLSSRNIGKVALDDLHEISIGKPVFDMTTYCGHRFSINGQLVGTLILGDGYTFDDKLVENLELLFKALV